MKRPHVKKKVIKTSDVVRRRLKLGEDDAKAGPSQPNENHQELTDEDKEDNFIFLAG